VSLDRSKTGIVGSNLTRGMDVSPRFSVLSCPAWVRPCVELIPRLRSPTKCPNIFLISETFLNWMRPQGLNWMRPQGLIRERRRRRGRRTNQITGCPQRPGFALGSIQWDLWWTKWHWDSFFSESFGFPVSISFHRGLHISEN
jgi:hypothetical protein